MRGSIRIAVLGVAVLVAVLTWAMPAFGRRGHAKATVVKVIAGKPSEFAFKLSAKAVKHGKVVVFKLTDRGKLPHSFKICASRKGGLANACRGKATPIIAPGGKATLKYKFKKPGKYEYLCTVPGHAAAGQKGDLKVT